MVGCVRYGQSVLQLNFANKFGVGCGVRSVSVISNSHIKTVKGNLLVSQRFDLLCIKEGRAAKPLLLNRNNVHLESNPTSNVIGQVFVIFAMTLDVNSDIVDLLLTVGASGPLYDFIQVQDICQFI